MLHFLLSLVCIISVTYPTLAQSADSLIISGRQMLQAGESANDLDAMYAARATFERTLADTSLSAWGHYYIALADYRIAGLLEGESKDPSEHLNAAVEHLKKATEIDPQAAEAYALLSSVYGWQIGLSPMKTMILGPRVGKAIQKAKQLAPDNPRVVLSAAISDFNTPEMFGGSKEKGLQGLQRAAELFAQEEPTDPIQPAWGHREAYAWLGIAYQNRGELEPARVAFEKALEIDPDFGWVKDWLLPELEKARSPDAP
ncbi:MAG: tetratricopeptide repeat protein [Gemmatimonadetes bacterium]|nr:tetratricopeptide repeat protein [Gemmatimonadota bacterium]MYC69725.1 tetratricopeptide repeat protein [Gemmatimonadota bacterium]